MYITSCLKFKTENAERYATRLSKHWAHKFDVSTVDDGVLIDFGTSSCILKSSPNDMRIYASAKVAELEDLQSVIIEHLKRFLLPDENLNSNWARQSESPID